MEIESYEINRIQTLAGSLGNSVFSLQNMLVNSHNSATDTICDNQILYIRFPNIKPRKKIIPFSFELETPKPAECLYQFSQKLASLINTGLAMNCELSCQLPLLFMLVMICSQSFSFPTNLWKKPWPFPAAQQWILDALRLLCLKSFCFDVDGSFVMGFNCEEISVSAGELWFYPCPYS